MPDRIDLFYFGDVGGFDRYNPFFLYKQKWAPEILFEIASADKYQLTSSDIAARLGADQDDIVNLLSGMENINMVSNNQNRYSVSFPVILEKDISVIDELTSSIASRVSGMIMNYAQEIRNLASGIKCIGEFGYDRVLYHAIGCDILDGSAMEIFAGIGIFSTSKPQHGHRNYILIGYEQNETVSSFSEKLLCSRNCTGTADIDFVSFGDCDGDRQDMFRFMKQVALKLGSVTANQELNLSYIHILEHNNNHLIQVCAGIVNKVLHSGNSVSSFSEEEIDAVKLLRDLKYVKIDDSGRVTIAVPLFDTDDERAIGKISSYLTELIQSEVVTGFSNLKGKLQNLSAVVHGVDEKEIANELWHQVFGYINEHLVRDGLFATPETRTGEGRYFQAIYVKGNIS